MAEAGVNEVRYGIGKPNPFAVVTKGIGDFFSPRKSAEGMMRRYDAITEKLPEKAQEIAGKLRPFMEQAAKVHGVGMLVNKIILAEAAVIGTVLLARKIPLGRINAEIKPMKEAVNAAKDLARGATAVAAVTAGIIKNSEAPVPSPAAEPLPNVVLAERALERPPNGARPPNGTAPRAEAVAVAEAPVAVRVVPGPVPAGQRDPFIANPITGAIGATGSPRKVEMGGFGVREVLLPERLTQMNATQLEEYRGRMSEAFAQTYSPQNVPDTPDTGKPYEDREKIAGPVLRDRKRIFNDFEERRRRFNNDVRAALEERGDPRVLAQEESSGLRGALEAMYDLSRDVAPGTPVHGAYEISRTDFVGRMERLDRIARPIGQKA